MTAHGLTSELIDGVLRLTISRPDSLNALDGATCAALTGALRGIEPDGDVRVVVVTGEGESFSSGADLAELGSAGDVGDDEARRNAERTMAAAGGLVTAVVTAPVPVIARVVGPAVGIGASLAFASDLIYAGETALFLLAFARVGLMPDGGSSLLVPTSIGRARANAMVLLAEPMHAREALAAGLVNEVLSPEELDARVDAVARRLSRGPRRALQLTKRAMTATTLSTLDQVLARETEGQVELLTSPDFAEGASAVLEHRRPSFSGPTGKSTDA